MTLIQFAGEMDAELRKNAFKGGWSNCTKAYLLRRLRQEVKELATCLKNLDGWGDHAALRQITSEAADVANFAYMIADNFGKEPGK